MYGAIEIIIFIALLMADLVATALKVSIYKTDSFSFGKYPKNSLLEKTNPILWNRILLLAFSDIFVFDRSKNMPNLQNEPNYVSSYIQHGLQRYF
jgi:hypothetical protein